MQNIISFHWTGIRMNYKNIKRKFHDHIYKKYLKRGKGLNFQNIPWQRHWFYIIFYYFLKTFNNIVGYQWIAFLYWCLIIEGGSKSKFHCWIQIELQSLKLCSNPYPNYFKDGQTGKKKKVWVSKFGSIFWTSEQFDPFLLHISCLFDNFI